VGIKDDIQQIYTFIPRNNWLKELERPVMRITYILTITLPYSHVFAL